MLCAKVKSSVALAQGKVQYKGELDFYESLCKRVVVFYVLSCKGKLRQKGEVVFYVLSCTKKQSFGRKRKRPFRLRCVRKEGKVFFRLRLKILISSTSKRLNKRVRIYYKVWTKFLENRLIVFTKSCYKFSWVFSSLLLLIFVRFLLRRHIL